MPAGSFRADLLGALVLLLAGSLLGLLWNPSALRPGAVRLEGDGRPVAADWLGSIERQALLEALRAGRAQLVDARQRSHFEAGHIPGALPAWDAGPRSLFRELLMVLDPDQPLIVVDDRGDGFGARRLAGLFAARGHSGIGLLVGGVEGWREAGLPLARGWDFDPALYDREGGR